MQGKRCWQSRPYRPADQQADAMRPYICRLAPGETYIELEWLDNGAPECAHAVQWRPMFAADEWRTQPASEHTVRIEGLECWCEYELRVVREGGEAGLVRLARTCPVPGTVINYLHPQDEAFAFSGRALCSPSIVRTPGGALLASMDVFASRDGQNLSFLYRSEDDGATWRYVCDMHPLFWGNLFVHRGRLYVQGMTTEYGDVVIGASDDDGFTWTPPVHLFYGSSTVGRGWEQGPMPVLRANGRLYFSAEYGRLPDPRVSVLSVPDDADLLDPANWSATEPLPLNPRWPGGPEGKPRMLIEGNLIADREGRIVDLMRIDLDDCTPTHGKMVALLVDKDDPDAQCRFDKWVDMPCGSNSKSYILFDPVSDRYVAVGNITTDPDVRRQRNVVALLSSKDAYHWQTEHILLDYRKERAGLVGFQYPTFIIDGDDILLQLRTALGGARNYHDANYSTFHVIRDFRQYLR